MQTGIKESDRKVIWSGTGGCCPEGPHIYKRNGSYYLFISEGGTEYGHMVTVARSKDIAGPYEPYHKNPILSNRSHNFPINATGHSDIVEDQNGNWWAVCLGIRTISYPFRHNLGRETMLIPMTWNSEGWPVMGNNGIVESEIETENLPLNRQMEVSYPEENNMILDRFDKKELEFYWNHIYNPVPSLYQLEGEGVVLYGNETALSEPKAMAWIGRRQAHHDCKVRTELIFERVKEQEEAGITIYMNNRHHYEAALTILDNQKVLIFRRQIGSLVKIEKIIPFESERIMLEIEATKEYYMFRYSVEGNEYIDLGKGETGYLTTEVGGAFTGNYFALYATGNGNKCCNGAKYKWFEYAV